MAPERIVGPPGLLASVLSSLAVAGDTPIFSLDLNSGPLADRLAENVPMGPWDHPLFIGWGSEDEVIAPAIQDDYVASLCSAGQPLESKVYEGMSHFGVVDLGSPLYEDLKQWTIDRLDGEPRTDTCS